MPHNYIGLNRKDENFRKGIFIDPYDEPTYLTFALDFKFEEIPAPDPTAEVGLGNSPLFQVGSSNSAINFLAGRGYAPQANGLATFREILRYLTFQAPWYFQSLSGLGELYKQAMSMEAGYKMKDIELGIDTLEAIDMRIFELAGLYGNSVFDKKFRRERVPENLRWFSVDVYIAEFRNLRFRLPGVGQNTANAFGINTGAIGNVLGGGNIVSNVMDQYGFMKFTCRQCEFDFSETLPMGNNKIEIGTDGRQAEANSFKIKVGWVDEEVKYGDGTHIYDDFEIKNSIKNPWGDRNIGASAENAVGWLSGLPVIGESIENAGQKVMEGISKVGGLLNPALEAASNFADNPTVNLGDIYNTGYKSNGDEVPKRPNPPNGNVYG